MDVPNFKEKLVELFRRNASISTNEALSDALGFESASNISNYLKANKLPDRNVAEFCRLYSVKPQWLSLSLDDFVKKLSELLPPNSDSVWSLFVSDCARTGTDLVLVTNPMLAPRRGISTFPPTKPVSVCIGDKVAVQFRLNQIWSKRAKSNDIYGLFVWEDKQQVQCIFPSQFTPSHSLIKDGLFLLPQREPIENDKWWYVTGPTGEQRVIALLTNFSLDEIDKNIYEDFEKNTPIALNHLAAKLQIESEKEDNPRNWAMWCHSFTVQI
jgi:hypothetical protein